MMLNIIPILPLSPLFLIAYYIRQHMLDQARSMQEGREHTKHCREYEQYNREFLDDARRTND
jgi:hypothetical protein